LESLLQSLSRIDLVEPRRILMINNARYNAHCEKLFQTSKILPLPQFIVYFSLLFMCKYIHGFNGVWIRNEDRRHQSWYAQSNIISEIQ
jgi:succinate dehydrogenase hydrophobic anchor subunit